MIKNSKIARVTNSFCNGSKNEISVNEKLFIFARIFLVRLLIIMTVETKIKWFFSITMIFIVFVSNYKAYKNKTFQNGTSKAVSYIKGKEKVTFLFEAEDEVDNKLLIESFSADWSYQKNISYPKAKFENMLLSGMVQNDVSLPKSLFKNVNSGLYLVNETIPFVLKDIENNSEITIVYPYVNNAIYKSYNNKNVFSEKLTYTSLNRPQEVDGLTLCMSDFFNEIESNYDVSYISDLDLENKSNYYNSKVLIIYGDFGFATLKMKENILSYLKKGGKIILSSTKFLNNICEYNEKNNSIIFNRELYEDNVLQADNHIISNYDLTGDFIGAELGLDYGLNRDGENFEGGLILRNGHPVFKGVNHVNVPISSASFIAGLVSEKEDNLPFFDSVFFLASYNDKEELSTDKGKIGILECKINNGVLLSLGTKDWFSCVNYNKSKEIREITFNSINYLLKN